MPAPSWEDLDQFFDTDDFALTCTVTPVSGAARALVGIFDAPYLEAHLSEYDTDNSQPTLLCKAADVVGLKRGDLVAVPGEGNFTIMGFPHADGTGEAVLELSRNVGP